MSKFVFSLSAWNLCYLEYQESGGNVWLGVLRSSSLKKRGFKNVLWVRRIKRMVAVWRICHRKIGTMINTVTAFGTVTHLQAPLGIRWGVTETPSMSSVIT